MKLLRVVDSHLPKKKYDAIFETDKGRTKTVPFGSKGMDDYTLATVDKEQRERYRSRHAKDLQTDDPTRAGFLAYYILWGASKSMTTNISSYKKRYNL